MLTNPSSSSFGLKNKLCGSIYGIDSQNKVISDTGCSISTWSLWKWVLSDLQTATCSVQLQVSIISLFLIYSDP